MIERSPADDDRINTALNTATDRLTSWFLAEHYDPHVDNDHLIDNLYNGLRDELDREDLIRAVILCLQDAAADAARRIVCEACDCTAGLGAREPADGASEGADWEPW